MSELLEWIEENWTEEDAHYDVDEGMSDYVDTKDLEDGQDLYDLYLETGRNAAEHDVIQKIINEAKKATEITITSDEECELFEIIAEIFCLNID